MIAHDRTTERQLRNEITNNFRDSNHLLAYLFIYPININYICDESGKSVMLYR